MLRQRYEEPNWDKILSSVDWKEFESDGNTYRAGKYTLDGDNYVAIEKQVEGAPTEDGWVGFRWCEQNNFVSNWPTKQYAEAILNGKKISEVEDAPQQSKTNPIRDRIILRKKR